MYRVLMTESQDMIKVLKARRDVSLLFMSPFSILENKADTLSYTWGKIVVKSIIPVDFNTYKKSLL